MTQLPLHQSLTQYYQLRDELVKLLYQLVNMAEQRDLTIITDDWINGPMPKSKSYLVSNADVFNQSSLKAIAEQDILPVYKPFRIGVVGEFTRGKTTLLNALLETEVLTSDRRPNTATCTILKYAKIERIRVKYFDSTGRETLDIQTPNLAVDLERYTSDAAMDQEHYEKLLRGDGESLAEQIEEVSVWLPAEFLRQRAYNLVDTPGLGSVFDTHQIITYNAITQMDAVLFLSQFDPPMGEDEMIFMGSLQKYLHRFLFVLTKVDLAQKKQNPQLEIDQAINFMRSLLTEKLELPNAPIYPISAIAAMRDGQYHKSGIIQLVQALDQFIASSCGRERLLKLYRSTNTYFLWVEQDIQREIDELNRQNTQLAATATKLDSHLNYLEILRRDLIVLLQTQTQHLSQTLLEHISQLPERLQLAVVNTLDTLNLEELTAAPVHLRTTVENVVQVWFKEQTAIFIQDVQLLQKYTEFFLVKVLHRQVEINWANTALSALITPLDLRFSDTLLAEIQLSLKFASVPSIVKFTSDRIAKELLDKNPASHYNAYEKIVFDPSLELNIAHQAEQIFQQWVKSLSDYLEFIINQEFTKYRQQVNEQINLISQQQHSLQQRLNLIEQQIERIQFIQHQLESIKISIHPN
ncbi:MAG: dynamin family protein [Aulosira sp. DedQUE10]|nr:dynamin family protein [Aulosira sp. DedQUE10]